MDLEVLGNFEKKEYEIVEYLHFYFIPPTMAYSSYIGNLLSPQRKTIFGNNGPGGPGAQARIFFDFGPSITLGNSISSTQNITHSLSNWTLIHTN